MTGVVIVLAGVFRFVERERVVEGRRKRRRVVMKGRGGFIVLGWRMRSDAW
eukprot:CAMPEP_0172516104 /NCGR_PEP_ID=MMETSP1066-20121228/273371_1 /TAXON_ID=671091 /ORGANISM="Coscinodiscus wailesii, Strain CCMP2513" /LENGTH=50 /DNA_ID=CAMNT_0013297441 /DNA_START=331 /DNA_END=483 /DNA_ORIENTATION=-